MSEYRGGANHHRLGGLQRVSPFYLPRPLGNYSQITSLTERVTSDSLFVNLKFLSCIPNFNTILHTLKTVLHILPF